MDPLRSIFYSLTAIIGFSYLAYRLHLFSMPTATNRKILLWSDVCGAFLLFFLVKFLVTPAIFTLGYFAMHREVPAKDLAIQSIEVAGWLHFVGIVLVIFAIWIYIKANQRAAAMASLGGAKKFWKTDLPLGLASWLLAHPILTLVGTTMSAVITYFSKEPIPEQLAVEQMRQLTSHPALFALMTFSVVLLVPVLEEFLFRGLLQTWIKQHIGRTGAIFITSGAFAAAHFSIGQGLFNVELLLSLFVLSIFLGYLWERQQSLTAPVVLHGAINAVSMIAIYLGS